ncbi:MAG: GNAT family N-acetyltransferase [candidate division Zixibacteria bacterium]|nr:GNAT family N-acetyltransferase [candidate division Zixibacteria bacterium]
MAAVAISIVDVQSAAELDSVRQLFLEYADSLGVDLGFQDFESELATLPGAYSPPQGRLLLAYDGDQVAGCAALRPLDKLICEMKRMYLRPAFRGLGLGRRLAERLITEGRSIGYTHMRLDTLATMSSAIALYRSLGFAPIPPYRHNPVLGAVYFELRLR